MTPEELEELFRLDVEDNDANDPLWGTTEVYSYMDEALKLFCRETDYLSDSTTAEIVDVTVTADEEYVTLDPRIIKLRSVKLVSNGGKVTPVTYDQMEAVPNQFDGYASEFGTQTQLNWETSTGTPRYIITDMEKDKGRLAPIPTVDGALKLRVYRLPLKDVTEDCQKFEVTEVDFQRGLMHYMKYLAYSKNDADTFDEKLARDGQLKWEDFLTRAKRSMRRKLFSSTKGTVRYGGL